MCVCVCVSIHYWFRLVFAFAQPNARFKALNAFLLGLLEIKSWPIVWHSLRKPLIMTQSLLTVQANVNCLFIQILKSESQTLKPRNFAVKITFFLCIAWFILYWSLRAIYKAVNWTIKSVLFRFVSARFLVFRIRCHSRFEQRVRNSEPKMST